MATHSKVLAWRIPWTEEPGGLQSNGFQEVRHAERLTHGIRQSNETGTSLVVQGLRL